MLAGEHSGDLLGGDLLKELKRKSPNLEFFGIGGTEMVQKANLHTLVDIERLSVIGFWEAVKKYSYLKSLMDMLLEEIERRKCKYAILIDYPGFNLRLAERLRERNIEVIFYVSPQIWAWKFKRIFKIQKNVNLMLTLFQFEEELYREYGVNAFFVGHPLPKRIQESLRKENPLPVNINHKSEIVIALLPGSRSQEIQKLTHILLKSASMIHTYFQSKKNPKKVVFLLPNINPHLEGYIQGKIRQFLKKYPSLNLHYVFNASSRVMEVSDILLLASGTATLEGVYWEKPMVILYKVSLFTYFIASLLVRSPYIGLINILAGKEICRELIQAECSSNLVFKEAIAILENRNYRNKIIQEIIKLKSKELSVPDAAKLASERILEYIRSVSIR